MEHTEIVVRGWKSPYSALGGGEDAYLVGGVRFGFAGEKHTAPVTFVVAQAILDAYIGYAAASAEGKNKQYVEAFHARLCAMFRGKFAWAGCGLCGTKENLTLFGSIERKRVELLVMCTSEKCRFRVTTFAQQFIEEMRKAREKPVEEK